MCRAAFIDPGILPRKVFQLNKLDKSIKLNEFRRKHIRMVQNGHLMQYKYCKTCAIMRPLRSTHCHDCDNCVLKFDHHCPWLGQCVSYYNYRLFFIFVFLINILTIFMIALSLVHIVVHVDESKKRTDPSFLVLI